MASLVDQWGKPIKKEELLIEEAAPSLSGVRQVLSTFQTGGLTPERLASLMRRANEGDADGLLDLAEEMEEKDTHYLSVIGTRKRAVSQLDITVIPASDDKVDEENAQIIRNWLNRDQLEDELFDLLDAVGKGFSVSEILWDTSNGMWLPKDIKWRNPRYFEFSKEDGETLRLRTGTGETIPLKPFKYLIHTAKAKSGIPIRGGLVRPCAWMWLFKNFSIKDWVTFTEAYGQPVRLGKYGPGATQKDRDVLLRAVANIGSDAAAIIPESMQIEFIEAATKLGTVDGYERLCKFCDQQISKAVLGQTTTTDALSAGLAGNQAHNDVRSDIERSDAKQLAATINRQLIPYIISFNKGVQKRYPRIKIGNSEQVDIEKVSKAVAVVVGLGMKVSSNKLRETLNLPAPVDDKDVLTVAQQSPDLSFAEATMRNMLTKVTASENRGDAKDGIDQVVDELSSDWEEIMTPLVDEMEQVLANCSSLEEARQKFLELSNTQRMKGLADKLANASIKVRAAGINDVSLDGE